MTFLDTEQRFFEAGIGVVPDPVVAARLGITRQRVALARKNLGMDSATDLDPGLLVRIGADEETIVRFLLADPRHRRQSVATKLGTSAERVRLVAEKCGIDSLGPDNRGDILKAWDTLDWSKPNLELAAEWTRLHPDDPATPSRIANIRSRLRHKYGRKKLVPKVDQSKKRRKP